MAKHKRNTQGLRDILFDEIDQMRSGDGDPSRAMAVANLAKQIINTAKIELDFHREAMKQAEAGQDLQMGSMELGSPKISNASSVDKAATGRE
jgi:hypothetical protein